MADFKLTPRMRIWIGAWLTVLVVLVLVTVLVDIDDNFGAGMLGAWCGLAIAVFMVMRERAKKERPSRLDRERYGRR